MRFRGLCAIVILGVLIALWPMAFASPPDQSWLGGFFDDADYDDVVLLITGCSPAMSTHGAYGPRPAWVVIAPVAVADDDSVSPPAASSHHTRAPPAL
jgi:hypothetical protein